MHSVEQHSQSAITQGLQIQLSQNIVQELIEGILKINNPSIRHS